MKEIYNLTIPIERHNWPMFFREQGWLINGHRSFAEAIITPISEHSNQPILPEDLYTAFRSATWVLNSPLPGMRQFNQEIHGNRYRSDFVVCLGFNALFEHEDQQYRHPVLLVPDVNHQQIIGLVLNHNLDPSDDHFRLKESDITDVFTINEKHTQELATAINSYKQHPQLAYPFMIIFQTQGNSLDKDRFTLEADPGFGQVIKQGRRSVVVGPAAQATKSKMGKGIIDAGTSARKRNRDRFGPKDLLETLTGLGYSERPYWNMAAQISLPDLVRLLSQTDLNHYYDFTRIGELNHQWSKNLLYQLKQFIRRPDSHLDNLLKNLSDKLSSPPDDYRTSATTIVQMILAYYAYTLVKTQSIELRLKQDPNLLNLVKILPDRILTSLCSPHTHLDTRIMHQALTHPQDPIPYLLGREGLYTSHRLSGLLPQLNQQLGVTTFSQKPHLNPHLNQNYWDSLQKAEKLTTGELERRTIEAFQRLQIVHDLQPFYDNDKTSDRTRQTFQAFTSDLYSTAIQLATRLYRAYLNGDPESNAHRVTSLLQTHHINISHLSLPDSRPILDSKQIDTINFANQVFGQINSRMPISAIVSIIAEHFPDRIDQIHLFNDGEFKYNPRRDFLESLNNANNPNPHKSHSHGVLKGLMSSAVTRFNTLRPILTSAITMMQKEYKAGHNPEILTSRLKLCLDLVEAVCRQDEPEQNRILTLLTRS